MCFSPCQDWDQWCYGTFSYQPDVQPLDDGQGVLIEYNKVDSLGTRYILIYLPIYIAALISEEKTNGSHPDCIYYAITASLEWINIISLRRYLINYNYY